MTKIKLCGLRRIEDICEANNLLPDFIGFVFASSSKRCISQKEASILKDRLDRRIKAVGVFVNENKENVAKLLKNGIIDYAQLHGSEDEAYIKELKSVSDRPVIKAFRIHTEEDLHLAGSSCADLILLDAGAGDGKVFDWDILKGFNRPFLLAGGLGPDNVREAVKRIQPYGVDVSSGIETNGYKDIAKMRAFVDAVRSV